MEIWPRFIALESWLVGYGARCVEADVGILDFSGVFWQFVPPPAVPTV